MRGVIMDFFRRRCKGQDAWHGLLTGDSVKKHFCAGTFSGPLSEVVVLRCVIKVSFKYIIEFNKKWKRGWRGGFLQRRGRAFEKLVYGARKDNTAKFGRHKEYCETAAAPDESFASARSPAPLLGRKPPLGAAFI